MSENNFKRGVIVKLHQALMICENWPKLCQHTQFKPLKVKIMLLLSLYKLNLFVKASQSPLHPLSLEEILILNNLCNSFCSQGHLLPPSHFGFTPWCWQIDHCPCRGNFYPCPHSLPSFNWSVRKAACCLWRKSLCIRALFGKVTNHNC